MAFVYAGRRGVKVRYGADNLTHAATVLLVAADTTTGWVGVVVFVCATAYVGDAYAATVVVSAGAAVVAGGRVNLPAGAGRRYT